MSVETATTSTPAKTVSKLAKAANGAADRAEGKLSAAARRAEDLVHEGFDTVRERARSYSEASLDRIESAQKIIIDHVRERPMATTLGALGIGLVIGAMLSGRRH